MAKGPSIAEEAIGAVLNGQWKLLKLIGEGGVAAVYEAEDTTGGGRRAVKLLHQEFQARPSVVERFYQEAKACFGLRHPHIAGVEAYDYAEDGSPYIVMELLDGQSLHDFLKAKKPMRPEQAIPLVSGVLQALSVAHARGIIHRDLKPANLFLIPDGHGGFSIKVLDFGIAKVMDLAGGMGTKTRTGAVLGTPGYMSPEQVKSAKAVDLRSDLWATGVVLYEMLCCRHPWGKKDALARMVAVLKDSHSPISAVNPALSHFDPFFERALARDMAKRFTSAEEMAEELRSLLPAQSLALPLTREAGGTLAIPMVNMTSDMAAPALVQPVGGTAEMADPSLVQPSGGIPPTPRDPGIAEPMSDPVPSTPVDSYPGPAPEPRPSYPSTPRPSYPSYPSSPGVPAAPPAGYGAPTATQISGDEGEHHTYVSGGPLPPPVQVVTAAPTEPLQVVWWLVMLIALLFFAAGVGLGYVLGAG